MMVYTEQNEIDFLGLAALWACTFTGFINAGEHSRGRKASQDELDRIVGRCFRYRLAAMANYKSHSTVLPRLKELPGWSEYANPEWHYLVEKREEILAVVAYVLGVEINPADYRVAIMKTQYGTEHYCLLIGDLLINPDPNLHGEIIRTTEFIY